jgi:hypothetical protein
MNEKIEQIKKLAEKEVENYLEIEDGLINGDINSLSTVLMCDAEKRSWEKLEIYHEVLAILGADCGRIEGILFPLEGMELVEV